MPDDFGVKQQLSFHLTVDRHECIQMIPLNEIAWRGGDGAGQCNLRGIACELTVEDNNRFKVEARRNAEMVAAAVMTAMRLTGWSSTISAAARTARNASAPKSTGRHSPPTSAP